MAKRKKPTNAEKIERLIPPDHPVRKRFNHPASPDHPLWAEADQRANDPQPLVPSGHPLFEKLHDVLLEVLGVADETGDLGTYELYHRLSDVIEGQRTWRRLPQGWAKKHAPALFRRSAAVVESYYPDPDRIAEAIVKMLSVVVFRYEARKASSFGAALASEYAKEPDAEAEAEPFYRAVDRVAERIRPLIFPQGADSEKELTPEIRGGVVREALRALGMPEKRVEYLSKIGLP
jgi:hypothetical protein